MTNIRIAPILAFLTTACATPSAIQAPAYPIDRSRADHYVWGEVNDGWHLVRTPQLSIIEERIAPGSSEVRHYHRNARQFFYVLSGELTMEVEGKILTLTTHQGIEIAPGVPHKAQNRSVQPVQILVTSSPPSHGDRVEAPSLTTTTMRNP